MALPAVSSASRLENIIGGFPVRRRSAREDDGLADLTEREPVALPGESFLYSLDGLHERLVAQAE
jgi:hypothetical protein